MPQQVPYTTGNDLLAYRGDAGLAAGTNPGGILPQQGDPFGGISNTIDQINGELMQQKLLAYKQKQQDQEELQNTLAKTGGSVFNMKDPQTGQNVSYSPLPEDQKILDQKASDLRDMILRNKEGYMFDRNYLNAKDEYNNLVNHAGRRSVAYSQYNTEAAKSQDPAERNDITAQRNQEVGGHSLTDFHVPEPHLGNIPVIDPIDELQYKDPETHQNFGTKIKSVEGVDYEFDKHGIPNSVVYAPMFDFSTKGMVNAYQYAQAFRNSPVSKSPDYINKMNSIIDQNAAERGTKPVYAATVNPDGTITYNTNAGQVMTALNLEKHGGVQIDQDPSDAAVKQRKERAETTKALRDKEPKPTAEELKENAARNTVKEAYDQYNKLFDVQKSKGAEPPLYPYFWKARGIDPEKYNIYSAIPASEEAKKYLGSTGTTDIIDDKSGKKTGVTPTYPKYTKVVPIENKQTGDKNLVYLNENEIVAIKNPHQAISNRLIEDADHKAPQYEPQLAWVDHVISGNKPSPQPLAAQPQQHPVTGSAVTLPKIDQRVVENGNKIGVVNGKKYMITGKTKDGQYIGMLIQ